MSAPARPLTLISGANTGIGRCTALELAQRGHRLILACRSAQKTEPVLAELRERGAEVHFQALDLADLQHVQRAGAELRARFDAIDVLVNNAGLAGARGQTAQGFEQAFGVNHLGTFAFTRELLPLLRRAEAPRVVTVASVAHYKAKGIPWHTLRAPTRAVTGLPEYQVSKLCNVLFAAELAHREPHITSVSLHPGVVASDVWREVPWPFGSLAKLFMLSNEEGAKTSVHCATSAELREHNGGYFDLCRPKAPSSYAQDRELARELWQRSEQWLAEHA